MHKLFLFMLSSSSRTELGNIFDHLHSVGCPLHSHLSSWHPGFLHLVEGVDRVKIYRCINRVRRLVSFSSKYIDHIVRSPSLKLPSRNRKPGGESPPGTTKSDQDLYGV